MATRSEPMNGTSSDGERLAASFALGTRARQRVSMSGTHRAMLAGMRKTDIRLKQEIEQEMRWDPLVSSGRIRVSVDEGNVSLIGSVNTCAEKWAAEAATRRVGGIRTVAQHVTVEILAGLERTDSQIAAATHSVLASNVNVPATVTAKVENGWVILEGLATWNYERDAAERAVSQLAGVAGVHNRITRGSGSCGAGG
jgi:osmotically-inducible protein OsmY